MRPGRTAVVTGDPDPRVGAAGTDAARPAELEQLLRLAGSLEVGMDAGAFRRALAEHLQPLLGGRAVRLTPGADDARQAGGASGEPSGAAAPRRGDGGWFTFPLVAGDALVGTLDVAHAAASGRARPLSRRERGLLELAAPLLARAISNAQRFRRAQRRSAVDDLTGCMAISRGMELIGIELRRARRYARPVALLFIDLDRFKQINDRCGHALGDAALRAVGAALKSALRGSDVCCRCGGDEFVVLLPETPLEGARHVAESLRRRLARLAVARPEGAIRVTASVGVAAARPGELDGEGLVARADAAMYRAKRAGRNAVRVWS